MSLATKGVALKMPLSFLEPYADRGGWLKTNPPSVCVFLRRAKYTRANNAKMGEFWGVWYTQEMNCGRGVKKMNTSQKLRGDLTRAGALIPI
ncbi:unnamed protein product [Ectocarpus sp. CCAP 1310/34]|nr:unnamed protein product [Ectocarpus sp. CCAP 1310/34]